LNIEQGLTIFDIQSKYSLRKSHIGVACSEINGVTLDLQRDPEQAIRWMPFQDD
jgi:hypothetical protein